MKQCNFTPHQPFLEYNNKYFSISPHPDSPLFGVVWEVYQVDCYDRSKNIIIPDMCADLMVFYTDREAFAYFVSGDACIASIEKVEFWKRIKSIFGVKFCTGALGNLCKESVKDVGSYIFAGKDALNDSDEMIKNLLEAKDFRARWKCVEEYLIKRLESDYEVNSITKFVSSDIIRNHGRIRSQELEDATGYSARYLRKIVQEKIGISIKQLCQIVQFQWTYHIFKEAAGQIQLPDLALQSGYYDQSHMNLCIKKLTGSQPRNILSIYMK